MNEFTFVKSFLSKSATFLDGLNWDLVSMRTSCGNQSIKEVTAKSRHPLEEGDPFLFNCLKRRDFRLRGSDTRVLLRLFAVSSLKTMVGEACGSKKAVGL
ncbi:hypothetical protein [Desulfomicrobium apsheronum]|uniref:hypothetical protein n=1 Tax=Desulfomicrobium apsheronum TaxID=52560 RepID=UPI001160DACB|nr:hypothetical protein [Desulfomicrobium apsheronum]